MWELLWKKSELFGGFGNGGRMVLMCGEVKVCMARTACYDRSCGISG
jgi:hypothetical protein